MGSLSKALNEISRRSLSRRGLLLFEACICLPCALTVEPSIIIVIVAGCSTLAMRSCFDALMMISGPAIGSSRLRCKCRGSSQASLASWARALLPLTLHAASPALRPHCHTAAATTPPRRPRRPLHLPCGRCMHAFLLVGAGTAVAGHIRRSLPAR